MTSRISIRLVAAPALLLQLAIGLSACNIIVTKEPLFQPAAGAPAMKDGVWISEGGCTFDESAPAESWPGCAEWGVMRGNESFELNAEARTWKRAERMILSAGDPIVMQFEEVSDNGEPPLYYYSGLEALARDSAGLITAFESWPAMCGPPPPATTDASQSVKSTDEKSRTRTPLPGLTMDPKGGSNCTTTDPNVVRVSAKASKAWTDKPLQRSHWVRTGYH